MSLDVLALIDRGLFRFLCQGEVTWSIRSEFPQAVVVREATLGPGPFAQRAMHGLDGVRGVRELGVGINRGHRLGKARPAVHGGDPEVFDAPIVPIREHSEPEAGALGQLQAEPLLVAVPVQRQHGVHGFPGADRLSSQPIRPGQTVAADKSKDRVAMSMVRTRTERSCRSSYSQNRPMIGGSSRPLPSNPLAKFTNDEKALYQSYFSTGCW